MRDDDGTFSGVEIALFEARIAELLAADGSERAAIARQLMTLRDYHRMGGRAEALTAMADVVKDTAAGNTNQATQRLDKTIAWFDRSGGRYDRDLAEAVDDARNTLAGRLAANAEAPAKISAGNQGVGSPAPDRCNTCDGTGAVLSPAWRAWYDRQDDARKTWGANHRLGNRWSDTAAAKALDAAQPDEPEETSCTDCDGTRVEPVDAMASMSLALRAALEGDHETAADHFDRARQATAAKTGRDDETVEADIRALLERTPRDNDITRRAQAGTETRESSPKATALELGVEPTRRAAEQANDAHVATADDDAVGDDNPSPVERAQRAVLELKGRRALEEQYAQARERDERTVSRGHQRDGEPRSKAADTDRGPVLSAFDD